ncbi:conserved hypothetical protein [Hyella patelloides LEGE 07179]|uniref:Uncharacterized protein n=1 Tax=Hyella patelloides LEGE 07179 TaxID=945734 RepID=A0A563W2Z1_9CYAN|nr:hypothetical protein [Hyella patelloides]VEP18015.1 conserved hypothetical protein [Hyella patelloides LEGE 07179]
MSNPLTSVKQDDKRSQEPNIDIDLYSVGWFDGLIGFKPSQLEKSRNRGAA